MRKLMMSKQTIPMRRLTDDSDLELSGEFNFASDGITANVCVPVETKKENAVIKFAKGFDGNHTDPSYTETVQGWRVKNGNLIAA